MHKNKYLIICTLIACVLLFFIGVTSIEKEGPSVNRSQYSDHLGLGEVDVPEGVSTYGIFVSQDETKDMDGKSILLNDISKPLFITCNHKGEKSEISISLYYNFIQIPFKINKSEKSIYTYKTIINDNEEIRLPIYLENIKKDALIHKLLISVTTDTDVHNTPREYLTNNSVLTHVCEIKYCKDSKELFTLPIKASVAQKKYVCEGVVPLVLNTDYENNRLKQEKIPELPLSTYKVSKNDQFEMMYNITGMEGVSSALLIISVGDKQAKIDGENYKFFDIKEGETINGKINVLSPEEPGSYEVIGYVVFNPNDLVEQLQGLRIETSFRFTMEVV